MVMEKIEKVKELIVKAVKELNMYENFGYDLTEFNEIVNKTDDLSKLEDYVTNYLISKNMLDRGYEVGEFWMYIYKQVAGLN